MKSNLGTFNGFNTRTGKYVEDMLTAEQVIAWNHYQDGIVEFWPSGDRPEMRCLLGLNGNPTPRFLISLDRMLQVLGGDTLRNFLLLHYVVNGLKYDLHGIEPGNLVFYTRDLDVVADPSAPIRAQFFEVERMFESVFKAED